MAAADGLGHSTPSWFTSPGDVDTLAWVALLLILLGLYGIVTLYAAFDRWAEHRSKGTPLAKTIPTMLAIALLYEIFPLEHFHVFLPLTAVLLALMADWSRFHLTSIPAVVAENTAPPATPAEQPSDIVAVDLGKPEAARND